MVKKTLLVFSLFSMIMVAQSKAPNIMVSPIQHDFGYVIQGTTTSYDYTVSNLGSDILKINDVRPACGCTSVLISKGEILPHDTADLRVDFNSNGFSGNVKKSVYILSNDPKNPTMELTYIANVVKTFPPKSDSMSNPAIKFNQMSFDFGKINEGDVVTHIFKFENTGHTNLKIEDIKTSCGCTAALTKDKDIAPGGSGTLRVEFDSHYKHGQLTRLIYIKTNDPNNKSVALKIFADVEKGS